MIDKFFRAGYNKGNGKHVERIADEKAQPRGNIAAYTATGCSRAELAKRTGLTRAAVSLIVDECLRLGMLEEGDKNPSAVGRRSVGLRTRGGYGHRIGLNISREAYTLGLVDFGGKIIRSFRKEISCRSCADGSPRRDLRNNTDDERGAEGVFLGIGVTMPGPLSRERGVLLKVPNLSAWNNFPVRKYFEDAFSCPVCIDNNSNAAAQAEPFYNPDVRGVSFMELIVDSGLGSGVMLYTGRARRGVRLRIRPHLSSFGRRKMQLR